MKKILLLFVLLTLVFAGCTTSKGAYFFSNVDEDREGSHWNVEYAEFSGFKELTFPAEVTSAGVVVIDVSIFTEEGSLSLLIRDENGNEWFAEDEMATADFRVECGEAGRYTIRVEGSKHVGGFAFEWMPEE